MNKPASNDEDATNDDNDDDKECSDDDSHNDYQCYVYTQQSIHAHRVDLYAFFQLLVDVGRRMNFIRTLLN